MTPPRMTTGIALAFVCLCILGVMPIIANSRPGDFGALAFALLLSIWQLVFAVPLFAAGLRGRDRGIFGARLDHGERRRTLAVVLMTGAMFGPVHLSLRSRGGEGRRGQRGDRDPGLSAVRHPVGNAVSQAPQDRRRADVHGHADRRALFSRHRRHRAHRRAVALVPGSARRAVPVEHRPCDHQGKSSAARRSPQPR